MFEHQSIISSVSYEANHEAALENMLKKVKRTRYTYSVCTCESWGVNNGMISLQYVYIHVARVHIMTIKYIDISLSVFTCIIIDDVVVVKSLVVKRTSTCPT